MLNAGAAAPVNIGNPEEASVLALAEMIRNLARSDSEIVFQPRPEDDPELRCPDITRARSSPGWEPTSSLSEGHERTIDRARSLWG